MTWRKTNRSEQGQGKLEAIILVLGIFFILAIALPKIVQRAAALKVLPVIAPL